MAVTANSFRAHFPEFADGQTYLDSTIQYWATIAAQLVNADRWGDLTDVGIELFVAHNLVLEARALKEANAGKIPGQSSGVLNSKSVDKVSAGYDTALAGEEGAGNWNLTIYGSRFYNLRKLMGAGPVQVGASTEPSYSVAWPGPVY